MACSLTIASSIQAWLDFISIPSNKNCVTICTDFDLLGDLSVLKDKMSANESTFDLLCFTNQSELYEYDSETLKDNLVIRFISHPLKLDDLEKKIRITLPE